MRIFVNDDRYGSLGTSLEEKLLGVASSIEIGKQAICSNELESDSTQNLNILLKSIEVNILKDMNNKTKKYAGVLGGIDELNNYLKSFEDIEAWCRTIEKILVPTNQAIRRVPTSEATEIAKIYAKSVLDTSGKKGLVRIIRVWDLLTEELCLNKERDLANELFMEVLSSFDDLELKDKNAVLTACVQEFERRVGQKRKGRAGRDLESATHFIFKYFNISCEDSPSHFSASFEVDNLLKCNDGSYLGVCLKRTLRERWKESFHSKDTLVKHNVSAMLHIINNDRDLSDNKFNEMAENGHFFFIGDDSEKLLELRKMKKLKKNHFYPMSTLIDVVESMIKGEFFK